LASLDPLDSSEEICFFSSRNCFAISGNLEKAAEQIDLPTLVVRGARSRVVSAEGVAQLAKLIPHACHVDVAAAGHMVAGDQNDEFNAAILDFLANASGSEPTAG